MEVIFKSSFGLWLPFTTLGKRVKGTWENFVRDIDDRQNDKVNMFIFTC